ncbi:MAG: methyl-accepting chemotaxis protein [Ectothiorhodospiraceae bacterium]|nr:methyl-accepting chemotaxis protein [Ectothiorhodospiraceae bacterium]
MRKNLPVTGKEKHYAERIRLVSTTDLKGVIQDANRNFEEVSGFSRDELVGQPHNLVRHPDMPEAVYADFWATLKAGRPWLGVVKNRCKNGDHYWVSAYVSPVMHAGRIVGYQSVRTRPSETLKRRAEAVYARMRGRRAPGRWWVPRSLAVVQATSAGAGVALSGLGAALIASGSGLGGGGLLIAGLLSAVAGPVYLHRRLAGLAGRARQVFDNTVGRTVYGNGQDEVAGAELALAMLHARLNAVLGRLEEFTGSLRESATASSEASENAGAAIEQQEQEVEQVVTAMEEMVATVQEVSRNTADASNVALEASEQAAAGRQTITRSTDAIAALAEEMQTAAGAMEALRDETVSIRKVLDVINEIAGQTNLLALNAAIEAARAGESGRGFAVVADEVRELASRVGDSTSEIDRMIGALEERAEGAVQAMRRSETSTRSVADDAASSADAIVNIDHAVGRIRDMAVQIASATEEQAATGDEINRRMVEINKGIQATAQVAHGTRDTGRQLVAMIEEMRNVLDQFDDGRAVR